MPHVLLWSHMWKVMSACASPQLLPVEELEEEHQEPGTGAKERKVGLDYVLAKEIEKNEKPQRAAYYTQHYAVYDTNATTLMFPYKL